MCWNPVVKKCSQLHMRVMCDHEHERKAHTTSRHQQHTHTQQGLALCHRTTLDSVAHWWVPARTPTVYQCTNWEGSGWTDANSTKTTNDNRQQDTDKRQDKRVFRKQVSTHTLDNLHGGGASSPQFHEVLSNSVNESKWRRPESLSRSRRETEPITHEKITQEKINHETEYIKIPQNRYTDKVVDVTVVIQDQVSQIK